MKKYIIYLITNNVNGKIYVGRTCRGLENRWSVHKAHAKYWGRYHAKQKPYLCAAMGKYGVEAFSIKQIDEAKDFKEMVALEKKHILEKKSNDPLIGYNLIIDTYGDGLEFMAESSRKRISKSSHRGGGIFFDEGRQKWAMAFSFLGVKIRKRFENEEAAKRCYDKLTLYFRGDDAILHFPLEKSSYAKEDLENFVKEISKKKTVLSKYRGVTKDASGYMTRVTYKGNRPYLGSYRTEEESAIVHDKVLFHLSKKTDKLNFPERLTKEYDEEGAAILKKYGQAGRHIIRCKGKTSCFRGVSRRTTKTWEMNLTVNGIRIRETHETEESAARSFDAHAIKNNFPSYKLNFPPK